MDLTKFAEDDFDATEWINATFAAFLPPGGGGGGTEASSKFSGSAGPSPAEQMSATAITKLQMSIQETSASLDDACQQMLQSVPRILRELEAVQQESKILQDQMKLVKDDIQKVEQETAHSMEQLLALDTVKGRVLEASSALKEADNWTTLTSDVDAVFDSGDLQAIRLKVVGMQQSLEMLKDVPDYEERHALLESLKDRVEALMSPLVVAALSAESVETVQTHVEVFKDIRRVETISKRYQECQKAKLLQQWKEFSESASVSSEDKTIDRLPVLFNDILLPSWYSQLKWCGIVFGPTESPALTSQVIVSTLAELVPSMSSILSLIVKENDEDPVASLIQSKRISEGFCQRLISDLSSSSSSPSLLPPILHAVFEPYFSHAASFGDYARRRLLRRLDAVPLSHADEVDAARLLADSIGKVVALMEEAMERCVSFTAGLHLPGLQSAVESAIETYVADLDRVLSNLKARRVRRTGKTDAAGIVDVDWDEFQQALRIVHISGEVILKMEELNEKLTATTLARLKKLELDAAGPRLDVAGERIGAALRLSWAKKGAGTASGTNPLSALARMRDSLTEDDATFLGAQTLASVRALAKSAHRIAFHIVFEPLEAYLGVKLSLAEGESVTGEALPSFAESEYITEVGHYLMTVPQQLEPFVGGSEEDAAMRTAVRWGPLDSSSNSSNLLVGHSPASTSSSTEFDLASYWLDAISRSFTDLYLRRVLELPSLTPRAVKQLVLDLEYLHVVFEDLGVAAARDDVAGALMLFRSDATDVEEMAARSGAGAEMAARVAAIKGGVAK